MRMLIGKVEKLMDVNKSYDIVYFSIPQMLENLESDDKSRYPVAFPLTKPSVSPEVGDEIMLFQPDNEVDLFYYLFSQSSSNNNLELRSGNSRVSIKINKAEGDDPKEWEHTIDITNDKDDNSRSIVLHKDGINIISDVPITISSSKSITIEDSKCIINDDCEINDNLKVNNINTNLGDGNLTIGSGTNKVEIKTAGSMSPIIPVGFSCIPNCPMTGMPHNTNTMI